MHTEPQAAAPEPILPTALHAAADLSGLDPLRRDDLEAYAFHYCIGPFDPGLRPGAHVARLDGMTALVHGHVPPVAAIHAVATCFPDADAIVSDPPTWAVFTRHRITCRGGVPPTTCGCAPSDDAVWAYGADRDTPHAVPVTPVRFFTGDPISVP